MRTFTLNSKTWGGLVVAGFALMAANSAAAQDCAADSDCDAGFVCHAEEYQTCSRVCEGDDMCAAPTCQTMKWSYCANAPCSVNADCPSSMVCYAPSYTVCSGSVMACPMGQGGCGVPVPTDNECHQEAGDAKCAARYTVPCHEAADCGPGFACEEQIYTVCSGGSAGGAAGGAAGGSAMAGIGGASGDQKMMPVAGAGAAGGDMNAGCHDESSGEFACRLLELPCESNADCAAGLECQANPNYWSCDGTGAGGMGGSGVTGGMGGGTAGAAGSAGGSFSGVGGSQGGADLMAAPAGMSAAGSGPSSCTPSQAPSKLCVPPTYYGTMYLNGAGGAAASGNGSSGEAGRGPVGGATGAEPGVSHDAGVAQTDEGNGGMGGGTTGLAGATVTKHGDEEASEPNTAPPQQFSGCSVSGNDANTQLSSWLTLLGVVALGLRRRARRVA